MTHAARGILILLRRFLRKFSRKLNLIEHFYIDQTTSHVPIEVLNEQFVKHCGLCKTL